MIKDILQFFFFRPPPLSTLSVCSMWIELKIKEWSDNFWKFLLLEIDDVPSHIEKKTKKKQQILDNIEKDQWASKIKTCNVMKVLQFKLNLKLKILLNCAKECSVQCFNELFCFEGNECKIRKIKINSYFFATSNLTYVIVTCEYKMKIMNFIFWFFFFLFQEKFFFCVW